MSYPTGQYRQCSECLSSVGQQSTADPEGIDIRSFIVRFVWDVGEVFKAPIRR